VTLRDRWLFFLTTRVLGPITRVHLIAWRLSGGRLFRRAAGMPMLLLTTTGCKSGQARTVPLSYFRSGGAWVVIASNAGADHAPGWYHNLVADPHATVEIGSRRWPVVAEIADAPARARLWPGVQRLSAVYDAYRARTTREIPVVLLHPV
jgi:deazaflavin-dependent oxidoreductase (nitroreductase family)